MGSFSDPDTDHFSVLPVYGNHFALPDARASASCKIFDGVRDWWRVGGWSRVDCGNGT